MRQGDTQIHIQCVICGFSDITSKEGYTALQYCNTFHLVRVSSTPFDEAISERANKGGYGSDGYRKLMYSDTDSVSSISNECGWTDLFGYGASESDSSNGGGCAGQFGGSASDRDSDDK